VAAPPQHSLARQAERHRPDGRDAEHFHRFFVPWPELQAALALFGLLLATYLYRIPSRDRPRG
jgi:hypothetical protein